MATDYSSYWLGLAKSDVASLGFTVYDSYAEYATKYSFFDMVDRVNPDLIVADGHGDPNTLTGQAVEEVLRACTNNQILSDRVVCTISCLTGQHLGPDSRNKNANAYLGFVNEFSWIVTPPYNPAGDNASYSFQEIVRKAVSTSARHELGKITLQEAYNEIVGEFDYWINYYSIPPGSQEEYALDILLSLKHDKTGLITIGKDVYAAPEAMLNPIAPLIMGIATIAAAIL